MRTALAMLVSAAALTLVPAAWAEPPEILPEQWKSLVKAVRVVKRDYVAPVDDARLASACAFKSDATAFDDRKVDTVKAWKSLRSEVLEAFGPPSGVAVYPATVSEDHEVLIYRTFETDTSNNQYNSQFLWVMVNGLGIVEDVRFSGSSKPIPPPAPVGGGVPIQIYTPPRSRSR